ncbi:hypothetical protein [Erysipelothrix sp. HDW6C]|nr:hypothetical protein [Erysipelothrix sp. HDW6C]
MIDGGIVMIGVYFAIIAAGFWLLYKIVYKAVFDAIRDSKNQ